MNKAWNILKSAKKPVAILGSQITLPPVNCANLKKAFEVSDYLGVAKIQTWPLMNLLLAFRWMNHVLLKKIEKITSTYQLLHNSGFCRDVNFCNAYLLTYWLTSWLKDWLTDWLTYWLAGRLAGLLVDWLTDWLTNPFLEISLYYYKKLFF